MSIKLAEVTGETSATEEQLAASLIKLVEYRLDGDSVLLRRQVERVLEYIDHVNTPNVHTLSHIRRILTGHL